MSDPLLLILALVLAALYLAERAERRADRRAADRERAALLDRIQARTLPEYKALADDERTQAVPVALGGEVEEHAALDEDVEADAYVQAQNAERHLMGE